MYYLCKSVCMAFEEAVANNKGGFANPITLLSWPKTNWLGL